MHCSPSILHKKNLSEKLNKRTTYLDVLSKCVSLSFFFSKYRVNVFIVVREDGCGEKE